MTARRVPVTVIPASAWYFAYSAVHGRQHGFVVTVLITSAALGGSTRGCRSAAYPTAVGTTQVRHHVLRAQ